MFSQIITNINLINLSLSPSLSNSLPPFLAHFLSLPLSRCVSVVKSVQRCEIFGPVAIPRIQLNESNFANTRQHQGPPTPPPTKLCVKPKGEIFRGQDAIVIMSINCTHTTSSDNKKI